MPIPVPASLVRHLKERRCVLFVGAGLSAAAGLPDWKTLLRGMVDEIESEGMPDAGVAELRQLIDANKLLDVADHCRQRLGERRYQEVLGDRLRGGAGNIPDVHRLVTQLPFSAIVTTNYDKLLERAYSAFRGELPKVVTSRDRDTLGSLLFSGGFFILKAHGDIDDAASLVLTARDYREIIHANPAFDALFSAILMTRSLLIVGYSLADPDFRLLLDRQLSTFGDNIPERYAVMSGVGVVEADVMKRAANIKILAYPEGQHQELAAFLRTLFERVAPEPAAAIPAAPPVGAAVGAVPRVGPGSLAGSPEAAAAPESGGMGVTPAVSPPPGPGAPAHLPAAVPVAQVSLVLQRDRLECHVLVDGTLAALHLSDPVSWSVLYVRVRDLLQDVDRDRRAANYERLGRRLGDLLPPALLSLVPADHVLSLAPGRELADLPWELAIPRHDTQPLALARATVRTIAGDAPLSRGLPGIRQPIRALIIGDTTLGLKFPPLPGAYQEAVEIEALYRADANAESVLLAREAATLEAVVDAIATNAFDVIHFAGHAWFDQHESFLVFGEDDVLTTGELRSLIGPKPPAILVLNSHYTAFLPRGMRPAEGSRAAGREEESTTTSHIGFMHAAFAVGVGAFVGCFESPADRPATQFGVGLHQELLHGRPIAHAVRTARVATLGADSSDVTALQYVLAGHPGYCLPDRKAHGSV